MDFSSKAESANVREGGYSNCQTRCARCMEKITEIYGIPRACSTRTLCVNFLVFKYTVSRLYSSIISWYSSIRVYSCIVRNNGYGYYYVLGTTKTTDVGTCSFRWIIHFWYFCLQMRCKAISVRCVGTFFDIGSNLIHLLLYNFKKLPFH